MPKVSVIMPSLNVALYIRECMDSVVNQSLKDLELICVDGGSTDGTWEILNEYARTDSRIRLFHSEKKSYGYQMNLGIREAQGEYIGIVETDDYILPEMYEALYDYAAEHNADFVKSDFNMFTTPARNERLFLNSPLGVEYGRLITTEEYAQCSAVDTFIWNGIYKRTFLRKHEIWFQETPGAAFQDSGFRYQVALCVKRGFFIKRSFYHYRRDNAGSSTYNSKCVLFNWAESKYILKIAQERGWTDHIRMGLLAKNIVQNALGPYMDMLAWCKPADGTNEALIGFRGMFKDFIGQGSLGPLSVPEDTWLLIRMFMAEPGFFEHYANLKANALVETIQAFLKGIAEKEQIILFGSGKIGACAYCTIRNSGLQNVVAFCDNNPDKWGTKYMGCPVKPPDQAVKQFPEAYLVITNGAHQAEIKKQLLSLGIPEGRIAGYNLNRSALLCTNVALRSLLQ